MREGGADRRDIDAGAGERLHGGADERVVHADGGGLDVEIGGAEAIENILPQRVAGLGAEALDAAVGIVGIERRQVDQGDGLEQPGELIVLLDGAARTDAHGAALQRRAVHADAFDPIEIQRVARIAFVNGF
ncbi:hypothetical protein D3C72_2068160 [compost metagenome]